MYGPGKKNLETRSKKGRLPLLLNPLMNLFGTYLFIAIVDPAHFTVESHTYQFFKASICVMNQDELQAAIVADKLVIQVPFVAQLPIDQGASYIDKKGSVTFSLQRYEVHVTINALNYSLSDMYSTITD